MGVMRFQVTDRQLLAEDAAERITMRGLEGIPWRSRTRWEDDLLLLSRDQDESGSVQVPCRTRGGEIVLTTASLMERERPYQLEVELARGTLNTVRNQIAAWQLAGLVVSVDVAARLADAQRQFATAATAQSDPARAAAEARATLETAIEVDALVGTSYTKQALAVRRRQTPQLPSLFGIHLGRQVPQGEFAATLAETFNTAVVPLGWRDIEPHEGQRGWELADRQIKFARQVGLKVCSGPLLQLDGAGIPDWTYLWEGDVENLSALTLQHVRNVVERYRGQVQLWQVAGRANLGDALALSEEQRFQVIAQAIATVRQLDARTPIVASFDQPWGEYLAQKRLDFSPLHFADALIRSELGVAGLGLEVNAGYGPPGTPRRLMLDYSTQLDRWSQFGLPLLLGLTFPSGGDDDPHAAGSAGPLPGADQAPPTPAEQREWIERYVPLMLAKNCVQGVIWNQLSDADPHDFALGGLVDCDGEPKPALQALRELRQEYLA